MPGSGLGPHSDFFCSGDPSCGGCELLNGQIDRVIADPDIPRHGGMDLFSLDLADLEHSRCLSKPHARR